ncbi:MAG: DEAD/DEAH box helicase [Clostridia bacterium]
MNKTFEELNLKPEILSALTDMGFTEPTDIQSEVIPYVYDGRDCLAQAPTGTGKTCAFGIPILSKIEVDNQDIQVLIMCPTRELVMQTEAELNKVAKYIRNIKILAIYGGQNIEKQLVGLRRRPQIVVGTTGRIMDHLRRRTLKLGGVKTLVLDEADEMLNMGFREDIDVILSSTVTQHQTILFSATIPKEILEISKLYQNNPINIKTTLHENDMPPITQYYLKVSESRKADALLALMKENDFHLVLVFCNTKRKVDELNDILNSCDYVAEALHGDLRQRERDSIMKRFRSGDINILVATDVAARGIDVEGIEAVFNYDLPRELEYYVHRVGRTARANKSGISYSFIESRGSNRIKEIERFTKNKMTEILDPNKDGFAIEERKLQAAFKSANGNIAPFTKLVKEKLEIYNEQNSSSIGLLELCGALLKLESSSYEETTTKDSNNSKAEKTSSKSSRGSRNLSDDSTRYFLNVGSKDGLNESDISKAIVSKTNICADDIIAIKVLDMCSFAEIVNGFNTDMLSLIGANIGKRKLNVELATGKKTSDNKGKFSKRSNDTPNKKYSIETKPFEKYSINERSFENNYSKENKTMEKQLLIETMPFEKKYSINDKKPFDKRFSVDEKRAPKKNYTVDGKKSTKKTYTDNERKSKRVMIDGVKVSAKKSGAKTEKETADI